MTYPHAQVRNLSPTATGLAFGVLIAVILFQFALPGPGSMWTVYESVRQTPCTCCCTQLSDWFRREQVLAGTLRWLDLGTVWSGRKDCDLVVVCARDGGSQRSKAR
jgi:hypothetical protein